jgi:hypothetical protein
MKKNYTLNDLTIRSTNRQTTDNEMTAHTHTVLFDRPLTVKEQQQFTDEVAKLQNKIKELESKSQTV